MLRISHIYALISFWYKQQIKLIPADRWKQFKLEKKLFSIQVNPTALPRPHALVPAAGFGLAAPHARRASAQLMTWQ